MRERVAAALCQYLGPELLCKRTVGSREVLYLRAEAARALATEIFGGQETWACDERWHEVDYCSEGENGWTAAVAVAVRITTHGTFHEDVGHAAVSGGVTREDAIDHARRIAHSDAMKRALRQFGSALGNCLGDSQYSQWLLSNYRVAS